MRCWEALSISKNLDGVRLKHMKAAFLDEHGYIELKTSNKGFAAAPPTPATKHLTYTPASSGSERRNENACCICYIYLSSHPPPHHREYMLWLIC